MSALGYLSTAGILYWQFAHGSDSPTLVIKAMALQIMLPEVWIALAAPPVAIASAALAHAAQTGRWGWLAGWIALTALALLSVSPEVQLRMSNGMTDAYFMDNPWIGSIFPNPTSVEAITPGIPPTQYIISIVAPAVIMLVALLYARIVMRPESGPQAAGLAVA
ncbi:MAG TPA: hypothetical protein VFQ25_03455 [Ktedonobacterales bacterium]|nr:hypothetical protein [Ktedonobacterales bacterium]